MDKIFIAIKDKIEELEAEIRYLMVNSLGSKDRDTDLKEARRKRQLLQDVLSILEGHNIIY